MANYQSLKTAINAVIKANGNKEITGTVLNEVLLAMVNSLGAGYQFAGVATPSTNPGTPDQKVFYIASQAGTYTNFNGAVVSDGIAIFEWNGTWTTETLDLSMAGQVQSDWTETDTAKKSYIKHKPNIPPSANVDPTPTEDSPNAVSSGGTYDMIVNTAVTLFGDIQDATNVNAIESVDGKIYNDYQAGDIFFIVDNNVRKYRVALVAGTADAEHPVTISPVNFYYALNSADAINLSLTLKTVSTEQQSLSSQQKAQARTNIAAVSYDQQSLNAEQQVQAQNNMMGKAYAPAQNSGLGKVYLDKNNGVLTQAMMQATNTVYVIQYDYTMNSNITVPANCVLEFDGGSISGNYTITGNNTGIQAGLVKIFNTDIIFAGTWNASESYPEWFGALGDGTTDDTDAIRSTIKLAYYSYGNIILDNKIYIVTPNQQVDWNVHPDAKIMYAAFIMKSNLSIKGNNSTIKVADNFCTPLNRKNFSIFFSNEKIENVSFEDIVFDCNSENNRVHTSAPESFYLAHHASILVSSIYGREESARLNNLTVRRCSFINSSGITCIGAVSTNTYTTDTDISRNWIIEDCLFKNNGLDTADHSSVYAQADDVLCENNTFYNDEPFPNGYYGGDNVFCGALCPFEIHGDNQRFINNIVVNYHQALWITPVKRTSVKDVIISNNIFKVQGVGIRTQGDYFDNILINNNLIEINGDASVPKRYGDCIGFSTGINLTNLRVINNLLRGKIIQEKESYGIALYSGCSAVIKSNIIENVTFGLYVAVADSVPIYDVTFCDNILQNMYNSNNFQSAGVYFINSNTTEKCIIKNNHFNSNYNDSPIAYGVYLKGSFGEFICTDNIIGNVTNFFVRNSATFTKWKLDVDASIDYPANWRCGDTLVTIGNGSASANYIIKGDQITFSANLQIGSTTILPEGLIRIPLPFMVGRYFTGLARIRNNGIFYTRRVLASSTNVLAYIENDNDANVTTIEGTRPFTFGSNDLISVTGTYFKY